MMHGDRDLLHRKSESKRDVLDIRGFRFGRNLRGGGDPREARRDDRGRGHRDRHGRRPRESKSPLDEQVRRRRTHRPLIKLAPPTSRDFACTLVPTSEACVPWSEIVPMVGTGTDVGTW